MHIVSQVIILLLCTLLASAAAIIAMLVSLSRQGDERRRMIVEKASARSFLYTVPLLLLSALVIGYAALVFLGIIAALYAINLAYYKKKFGD